VIGRAARSSRSPRAARTAVGLPCAASASGPAADRPGLIAQDPGYAAAFILRALRTGEERIDIPHGAEQPGLTGIPARQPSLPAAGPVPDAISL
jgi:hypothetical protein